MTSILRIPNYKIGYQYNTNVMIQQQNQLSSNNHIILKSDFNYNNCSNNKILALSSFDISRDDVLSKRNYMADYKPFSEFYGYKNLGTQVGKGLIFSFSMLLLEFNLHLDEIVRSNAEQADEPEPFNWELKINNYIPIFKSQTLRFLGTSFFKSLFELFSYKTLVPRLTDKLTKDLHKSIERKCKKHSRTVACKKIFKTAFLSNSILLLSTFAFDACQGKFYIFILFYNVINNVMIYCHVGIYNTIVNKDYSSCKPKSIIIWTLKKSIFIISLDLLYSTGFSCGSLFSVNYGGLFGSVIFELIGSQLLISILEL